MDILFNLISDYVSDLKTNKSAPIKWSDEIAALISIRKPEPKLLVNELFFSPKITLSNINKETISREMAHDLSLLAINPNAEINYDQIKHNFLNSRPYLWLLEHLKQFEGEIYFGKLTELLHNDLFDDPKPYRRDVKQLLSNLLGWISSLNLSEIVIDQPNHSQRIRFNSN